MNQTPPIDILDALKELRFKSDVIDKRDYVYYASPSMFDDICKAKGIKRKKYLTHDGWKVVKIKKL